MKKILFTIIIVLSFAGSLFGQLNANRTAKTKVSDALAMLPAAGPREYVQVMTDLVSTGNEGIDLLTAMFDNTNNAPVNYALSGWAAYVTSSGNEINRQLFESGILRALAQSGDPEIKAFYMRLLQQAGGEASVKPLAAYIADERLGDPAIAALVSIRTPEVNQVIADAVRAGRGNKIALAKAVGDIKVMSLEGILSDWLRNADVPLQRAIYYALGRVGTFSSLKLLRVASAAVDYKDDPTQVTRQYIRLMQDMTADGFMAEMGKEALSLMKKAALKKATDTRLAAFDIYVTVYGLGAMPELMKLLNDSDRVARVGALQIIRPYATPGLYNALLGEMGRMRNPEAKEDVIAFVGESDDPSFTASILPLVGNANVGVNTAAMWAATRLGGDQVPAALVSEMKKENAQPAVVDAAKACLLSFKGRVNDQVAFVLEGSGSSAAGKIAALEVLASRRAVEKADAVIGATRSSDPEIVAAAYAALPDVVSEGDLPVLYAMLESAADAYVSKVQQAVVSALATRPKARRLDAVTGQMAKAGDKKARYYVVLAGTEEPRALDIIAEGYAKGSNAEKAQAVAALLAWKGIDAAGYLYDIAKANNSDQALRGYVSLVSKGKITPEMKQIMLAEAMEIARSGEQRQLILGEVGKLKTFQSLIFAGRYLDDENAAARERAAVAVMDIALANKTYYGPAVTELLEKAAATLSGPDADYQREAIRKHLSEQPREGGYVSLFNGKDYTGWKGLVENPIKRAAMSPAELAEKQVKADELMRRDWAVQDGSLVFVGEGYDNICTEKPYGDFEMYVDWLLYPDGPEADGGIYLRGSPQVQMWDTTRRNVGAQVGSGGLYNNRINPSTPSKVADNKMGHWNTFYIKMVGDRVTVVLNGEKVVDNVILENYWDRSLPIFPVEQIELQAHGTRVAYRNLYINELPMQEPYRLSAEEEAEGYEVLFDGTNMHKWIGNTKDYVAEEGAIVLYPSNGGGGNLYTKDEFDDFVFRFEFMLTPGANNGLGIRTPTEGDAAYVGMELQILDNDAPIYSKLEEWQYHGSVYGVIPARRGALKPNGEWNYQEVYAKGNHIRITLNGVVILAGDIGEAAKNGTIDGKEHPGLFNKSGHIGFLGHGSVVKFKNIRVKRLND